MLRITTSLARSGTVLKLEGRLGGPWVGEARRSWDIARRAPLPLTVDLSDVDFVDDAGKDLLATMHSRGSRLVATSCLMKAIVDEVSADCAPLCRTA